MRIGSDGLGKRQLDFHFQEVSTEEGGDAAVLKGKTTSPVIWKVTLVVGVDDIPNLVGAILSPPVLRVVAKYFLRRAIAPLGHLRRARGEGERLPVSANERRGTSDSE